MNRYLAAAIIAGLMTASALVYASHLKREFFQKLRETFRQAKAEGAPDLSNVDIETMQLADFGIRLTNSEIQKYRLANLIDGAWFVWAPLLLALCIGVARLWPRHSTAVQASTVKAPA